MRSRFFALLALLSVSAMASADSLDINLHDKAMRVIYGMGLDSLNRGTELEFGHMYNQDHDTVSHIGFIVSGENWSKSGVFDIGIGGRAVLVRTDPADGGALALGGRVRFSPLHRLGIGGFGFYAPQIVTSGDGENYAEYGVRLDYQLLPQAFVYVGYRKVEFKVQNGPTLVLDDHGNVGMRLLF